MTTNTRNELLTMREELMERVDSIVDDFFYNNYNGDTSERDELVTKLCDMICETIDPVGL
jgi:hypothetical protein